MTLDLNLKTNLSDGFFSSHSNLPGRAEKLHRILIVDDEELVRCFHLNCLSSRYKCFEAASAEEALEILKEKQISLVITDWVMGGMSGTTLLRRIVREFPDTFVVMITGVDHPERSLDALRFGAFDYILKPTKPEIIELTVERALEQREAKIKARQYKIDLELQNIELNRQRAEIEKLQKRLKNAEETASVEKSFAEFAHGLNNPPGCISGNLQILDQYFQDLRELIEFYDAAEIPEKNLSKIERFKKKIHFEKIFENVGAIIADCAAGAEKVSRLVQNVSGFSKFVQTKAGEYKEE